MIGRITPGQAGIPEERIRRFLSVLRRYGLSMHSVLMMRGNDVFFERYWAPFDADTPHRMYSVTKSFTAIAIGCLLDEGKLRLDDPIIGYFPDKQPDSVSPLMEKQTIRDMLCMRTVFEGFNWFLPGVVDRTAFYFAQPAVKPADTLFSYDSTGSYILGALVERLSGMSLLDYLKQKVLDRIGGFENAQILKTPDGTAWGDSALLCTPMALLRFARFVMNGGVWEGERLLSAEYLREATAVQVMTDHRCKQCYNSLGYGYQIWATERGGFSFHGMGSQYAICVPEEDFIFVCTGDNQYNSEEAAPILFRAVFEDLLERPEEEPTDDWTGLPTAGGRCDSPFAGLVGGTEYICEDNPMGISRFRLTFDGDRGCFAYTNRQGEKRLEFGMERNVRGKFPELGYSDERGNVHEITDFRYDCEASAGWRDERTLRLRVQIVDRYLGSLAVSFGFTKDAGMAGVVMVRHAEDFLSEYEGWMIAKKA